MPAIPKRAVQRLRNTRPALELLGNQSGSVDKPFAGSYVPTKAVAILGVEAGAINEVDTTADHIPCGERGTIRLACPRGAEGMPIIAMVTIGMFVPTCEKESSNS